MIRLAREDDLPALLPLALAMRDEAPLFRGLPFDEDRVDGVFRALVGMDGLIVADMDGGLVGFMGFHVATDPWTGILRAHEDALYVAPDWRRAGVAVSLVQAAEGHASRAGAAWIDGGDHSGNGMVGNLYAGLGYRQVGTTFRKALAPAPAEG